MEDFRSETYVAIYRYVDGMLICIIKKDQIIDRRLAERVTRERLEIVGENRFPTLIILPQSHLMLERSAFEYFGSKAGVKSSLAMALVMRSTIRSILTNINFLFYNQKVPFRVFTKRAEAKLWLFGFIEREVYSEDDI